MAEFVSDIACRHEKLFQNISQKGQSTRYFLQLL